MQDKVLILTLMLEACTPPAMQANHELFSTLANWETSEPSGNLFLKCVCCLLPPSMQNMVFCQLYRQNGEAPMGAMLVVMYAASLVTLTAWIAFMLYVVSD